MILRPGLTYLVVGLAALVGAVLLLVDVIAAQLHPAVAVMRETVGAAQIASGPQTFTPGLRAQVVLDWQPQAGLDAARCCTLVFRVTDAAGAEIAADRVALTVTADAEPQQLRLRKWQPPPTGLASIEVAVEDADGQPAPTARLAIEVRHGLKDPTVTIILAAFMGIGGVIAFTVGAVRAVTRPPRATAHGASAAQVQRAAMLCHASALSGYLLPFGNIVAPFVMWVAGRDLDPAVERAGREALNFQLSILFYLLLAFALTLALIGVVIMPLLIVMQFVFTLRAARAAARGDEYRYPLTFRMV